MIEFYNYFFVKIMKKMFQFAQKSSASINGVHREILR